MVADPLVGGCAQPGGVAGRIGAGERKAELPGRIGDPAIDQLSLA
jgi:hypothetical protein